MLLCNKSGGGIQVTVMTAVWKGWSVITHHHGMYSKHTPQSTHQSSKVCCLSGEWNLLQQHPTICWLLDS
jgi:hypothetical protein